LGNLRHDSRMIPWDHDADIAFLMEPIDGYIDPPSCDDDEDDDGCYYIGMLDSRSNVTVEPSEPDTVASKSNDERRIYRNTATPQLRRRQNEHDPPVTSFKSINFTETTLVDGTVLNAIPVGEPRVGGFVDILIERLEELSQERYPKLMTLPPLDHSTLSPIDNPLLNVTKDIPNWQVEDFVSFSGHSMWWTKHLVGDHPWTNCIQYHVNLRTRFPGTSSVDLFGVRRVPNATVREVPMEFGSNRTNHTTRAESFSYVGCYYYETGAEGGDNHTYFILPPVPCDWYEERGATFCPRDNRGYIHHFYGADALTHGKSWNEYWWKAMAQVDEASGDS